MKEEADWKQKKKSASKAGSRENQESNRVRRGEEE